MNQYEANSTLIDILIKHDFEDVTSYYDKNRGKRKFKLSKQSQKEIFFDHINIQVFNSNIFQDAKTRITEQELKHLLLYFKLKSVDYELLDIEKKFRFEKVEPNFKELRKELQNLEEFNFKPTRQNKLKAFIKSYEDIEI